MLKEVPKADAEVTELYKTTSKWDIVINGKTFHLRVKPCGCGIEANWVLERKKKDMLPEGLRMLASHMEGADEVIETSIMEWHWERDWKQKLMFWQTMNGELLKWAKRTRKTIIDVETKRSEKADSARSFLEEAEL